MKNCFYYLFVLTLFVNSKLGAQTNIDFESSAVGTYTSANAISGWTVSSQTNTSCNTSTLWTAGSPEFSIVSTPITNPGYFNSLTHSPLGGTLVAQLNDYSSNNSSTKIARTIPVSISNSALEFAFASIFTDDGHSCCQQSSLQLAIRDQYGTLSCLSFTDISTAFCNSVFTYTTFPEIGGYYSEWQVKYLDLSSYVNTTITLEVIVSDCTLGDHFRSLLMDTRMVNSYYPIPPLGLVVNMGTFTPINFCSGSSVATIYSPFGYIKSVERFKWFAHGHAGNRRRSNNKQSNCRNYLYT